MELGGGLEQLLCARSLMNLHPRRSPTIGYDKVRIRCVCADVLRASQRMMMKLLEYVEVGWDMCYLNGEESALWEMIKFPPPSVCVCASQFIMPILHPRNFGASRMSSRKAANER